MFRLLVFNQIYTEVALERSAHTAQWAPYGSWLYQLLDTGSNSAAPLGSLDCLK